MVLHSYILSVVFAAIQVRVLTCVHSGNYSNVILISIHRTPYWPVLFNDLQYAAPFTLELKLRA